MTQQELEHGVEEQPVMNLKDAVAIAMGLVARRLRDETTEPAPDNERLDLEQAYAIIDENASEFFRMADLREDFAWMEGKPACENCRNVIKTDSYYLGVNKGFAVLYDATCYWRLRAHAAEGQVTEYQMQLDGLVDQDDQEAGNG